MYEVKLFEQMPRTSVLHLKNGVEKFQDMLGKIYNQEEEKSLKRIANTIYDRLVSNDPNYHWTVEDYGCFKKSFYKVEVKEIDVLEKSIQKCLEFDNKTICEQLKLFSRETSWYPESDKIEDKNTNGYIYHEKEIKFIDCFNVCTKLVQYMYQFVYYYCINLTASATNHDEVMFIRDSLTIEDRNEFLSAYDEKFKYLEKYSLFADIYYEVRKIIYQKLLNCMRKLNVNVKIREIKDITYNKGINQHVKRRYKRVGNHLSW